MQPLRDLRLAFVLCCAQSVTSVGAGLIMQARSRKQMLATVGSVEVELTHPFLLCCRALLCA